MRYLCRECDEVMVATEDDRCYFCLTELLNWPNCPCGSRAWNLNPPLCYLCESKEEKELDRIWTQECARHRTLQECQDCGAWILCDDRCPSCESDHDHLLEQLMDDRFTALKLNLGDLG